MRKRLDNNAILSITATIVSVCALFVAAYQTILMRQQQSAAVWPKLIISNAFFDNGNFYRLTIRNVGIGPAVIRGITIQRPGQSFDSVDAYAKYTLTDHRSQDSTFTFDYRDLSPEDVIPQGEKILLIDVKGQEATRLFLINRSKFTFSVIYSSVYGEEWQVQFPHRKSN